MVMMFRGVRGATTVDENTEEAILGATQVLLQAMIESNAIEEDAVASVIFTTTADLNAAYPAKAARRLGWRRTALLGAQEADVPGGLPRCIRILIHWNTAKSLDEINHIFMGDAKKLRPDLFSEEPSTSNGRDQS
ncbi:MAG: chorismate mutase [Chloroflexi bacterium]|nr:MAG: chorismate mutase [Phototrophicales bacterium]RMF78399.1 MAG: chorismate mutase [Chloroflexota bacterium]